MTVADTTNNVTRLGRDDVEALHAAHHNPDNPHQAVWIDVGGEWVPLDVLAEAAGIEVEEDW